MPAIALPRPHSSCEHSRNQSGRFNPVTGKLVTSFLSVSLSHVLVEGGSRDTKRFRDIEDGNLCLVHYHSSSHDLRINRLPVPNPSYHPRCAQSGVRSRISSRSISVSPAIIVKKSLSAGVEVSTPKVRIWRWLPLIQVVDDFQQFLRRPAKPVPRVSPSPRYSRHLSNSGRRFTLDASS